MAEEKYFNPFDTDSSSREEEDSFPPSQPLQVFHSSPSSGPVSRGSRTNTNRSGGSGITHDDALWRLAASSSEDDLSEEEQEAEEEREEDGEEEGKGEGAKRVRERKTASRRSRRKSSKERKEEEKDHQDLVEQKVDSTFADGSGNGSAGVSHSAISQRMHSLLKVLQAPLFDDGYMSEQEDEEGILEGYLFKQKKRVEGDWQKKWFSWRRNTKTGRYCLYYYKNQDDSKRLLAPLLRKPRPSSFKIGSNKDDAKALAMIEPTFIQKALLNKHQKEVISVALVKKQRTVSSHYIKIFSKRRTYVLCASTDEELEQWYTAINEVLERAMDPEEYDHRLAAAKELEPLVRQKYYAAIHKAHNIIRALEKNGFFDDSVGSNRDKQGTLSMESDDIFHSWKKYRFILKSRYLYYYPPDKGHVERRVIVLKYSTVEYDDKPLDDGSYVFRIITPIITYVLKARHKVAMEEWIDAIDRSISFVKHKNEKLQPSPPSQKRKAKDTAEAEGLLKSNSGGSRDERSAIDPTVDRVFLEAYTPNKKKPKVFKLKKSMSVIGRSSSCDIELNDTRISREHARIDVIDNKLVFLDLGSKRGSKINHHVVRDRTILHHGDLLKVGRTQIYVLVEGMAPPTFAIKQQ
ncbi:PH domain containing protein [Balamuthia mandrillaris]